ncbi:DUF2142 domain-containing protein [Bifidobacterium goeldii]|nr:DUF2142 domain-containing protein [Bifidobacterium goeldii]
MMVQNVGPLTMPDPDMHVFASWALATGQSRNPIEPRVDRNGNTLRKQPITGPVAVLGRGSHMRNALLSDILYDEEQQIVIPQDKALTKQRRALTAAMAQDVVTVRSARANQYFPIAYAPQATGIRLALSKNLSLWDALTWGRIANLTTFVAICCIAIMFAGRWRWAFLIAAANPMSVFCASSLMADSTLIALGLLIGSLTVYAAQRGGAGRPVPAPILVVAGLVTIVLASVKIVYVPLIIPLLLLPNRTVIWWRKLMLTVSVLAAVSALAFWWSQYQYVAPSPRTDLAWNQQWMLAHPWEVVITIGINLLMYTWRVPFDEMFPYLAPIVLAYILTGRGQRHDADININASNATAARGPVATAWRWLTTHTMTISLILVYGLSMGATFGALMLTWTKGSTFTHGIASIGGFQGRYLWPLLGMLPLPWLDAGMHKKIDDIRKPAQSESSAVTTADAAPTALAMPTTPVETAAPVETAEDETSSQLATTDQHTTQQPVSSTIPAARLAEKPAEQPSRKSAAKPAKSANQSTPRKKKNRKRRR